MPPRNIYDLFDRNVPLKLIECIADLLRYDPSLRLTSRQCIEHPYLLETTPLNNPPGPPTHPPPPRVPNALPCSVEARNGFNGGLRSGSNTSLPSVAPRNVPPSHSHPNGNPKMHPPPMQLPEVTSSHRSSFYDSGFASMHSRTGSVSTSSRQTSEYSSDLIYSPRSSEVAHAEAQRAAFAQMGSSARSSSVYADGADRVANVHGWAQQQARIQQQQDWDAMDVSPQVEIPSQTLYVSAQHHPMEIQTSPMAQEYPARPVLEPEPPQEHAAVNAHVPSNKFSKLSSLSFGKKHSKWGLSMFGHGDKSGHHNSLPPVQENGISLPSQPPSLKRRESSSTDSRSLSELSPATELPRPPHQSLNPEGAKQLKKEQERLAKEMQKEAERQRRLRAEKMQREQARAVINNNRRLREATVRNDEVEWLSGPHGSVHPPVAASRHYAKGKQPAATGPIRQAQSYGTSTLTVNAAGASFKGQSGQLSINSPQDSSNAHGDWQARDGRMAKARRRDYDDDHSMSSDMHSRMSVISFATVDSDPGPGRLHPPQSRFGPNRMTSMSSLRSSADGFSTSAGRSSASLSLEHHLANDFHLHASVDSSSISDGGSPQPPPMPMLSLSSPIPWQRSHSDMSSTTTVDNRGLGSAAHPQLSSPLVSSPPPQRHFQLGPSSPYDTTTTGGVFGPPSPGLAPKSAINPIFKVVSVNALC